MPLLCDFFLLLEEFLPLIVDHFKFIELDLMLDLEVNPVYRGYLCRKE